MYEEISIKLLRTNTGQIEGLPANPRSWTRDELERLKRSIAQTPELLQARGLIVYPYEGKYIIMGGNMRYSAIKALGYTSAPCYVLDASMSLEKLKEIVIKDNGAFGEWDTDALANAWDDLPLLDWGCRAAWDTTPEDDEPEDDKGPAEKLNQVRVVFSNADDLEAFKEKFETVISLEYRGVIM